MRSFFDDEHATRELVLFAVNTGALYPERARLEKEAKKQIENGTYAVGAWQQIWRGWFDKAANRYVKELPKSGDPASLFPDRVRTAAAVEWEEYERGFVGHGYGSGGEIFGGAKPNPLRMGEGDKIAIGVGLVAGLAAVFYYLTRPSTTA